LRVLHICLNYIDQYVWKAGRATSAAPVYFKHFGKYIDGGIKANNPSMSGLTRIHEYYKASSSNYKIACVVSLGCGMFHKKMGRTDVHDWWFKLRNYKEGLLNITELVKTLFLDVLIAEVWIINLSL